MGVCDVGPKGEKCRRRKKRRGNGGKGKEKRHHPINLSITIRVPVRTWRQRRYPHHVVRPQGPRVNANDLRKQLGGISSSTDNIQIKIKGPTYR